MRPPGCVGHVQEGARTRRAHVRACVAAGVGVLLLALPASAQPLEPSSASATDTPALSTRTRQAAEELAGLVNRARVSAGQKPLAISAELERAAQDHSRDMAANDFLDHQGSDGSTPQERAVRAGYRVPPGRGWLVVEIISAISDQPAGPLAWWTQESPAVHGRVLLHPRWREMGVGYVQGGRYGNYWTVLFGCRPGVLPTVELDGTTYQHTEDCDTGEPPAADAGDASASAAVSVAGVQVAGPAAGSPGPSTRATTAGAGSLRHVAE